MSTIPRVVISAPSSGHGKTAVSVGLLAAFNARGYRSVGFKIGPDHVDAAYLGLAAGRPGRNLDPRMVGAHRIGPLFAYGAAALDIAVVEGTMGLFDGLAGRTDTESTAQISGLLRAPVVLVIDVGAMGQSVAALVHGFRAYDELLWLGGVILNRVASSRHEQLLREALDDIGVPVLGALRRRALSDVGLGAPLPSRQHGVAPVVHGSLDAIRAVRRLGEVIGDAIDIERTMALARSAPRLTAEPWSAEDEVLRTERTNDVLAATRLGPRPVIAVAGGPRFSFSYTETSELLRAAGAEVVHFDPLRDDALPDGVDGVVIGAGLPEGYAEDLSFNATMRKSVLAHALAGKPLAAEGTGLIYLCKDFDGRPMCGVLDATGKPTEMIVLGYREATARTSSVLLPAGTPVLGHKMHQTVVNPRSGGTPAWSWPGGPPEGFVWRSVHASYLALHWAGSPAIASRFVSAVQASRPAPSAWSRSAIEPVSPPASSPIFTIPPSGLNRPLPPDRFEDDISPFRRPTAVPPVDDDEPSSPEDTVRDPAASEETVRDLSAVGAAPAAPGETLREPGGGTLREPAGGTLREPAEGTLREPADGALHEPADAAPAAEIDWPAASERADQESDDDSEQPTEIMPATARSTEAPTEVAVVDTPGDQPTSGGPTSGGPTGGGDGDGKRPSSEAA
jgi:cobyrinic acid a,c-diamide synthase